MTTKVTTTFEGWLRLVDVHLVNLCGMRSDDMEDWGWHDAYQEGLMAYDAARQMLHDTFPCYDYLFEDE